MLAGLTDVPLFSLLKASPWLFWVDAGLLGVAVGSFLNVVVARLPDRIRAGWRHDAHEVLGYGEIDAPNATRPPGLWWPPSRCPTCRHRIRPWHNIPIVSWLWLRGRCADCGCAISPQYPCVEALCGLLFVLCALRFGVHWTLVGAWGLVAWGIALAAIDLREMLLPDELTLPLMWLGLLANSQSLFVSSGQAVWGAAVGYGVLWTVYQVHHRLTGKEGMGYGDFKLLAALGAWFGVQALPIILIAASVSALVVGGGWLLVRHRSGGTALPFGPALVLGGWVALYLAH